jgi:acyl carrier protein
MLTREQALDLAKRAVEFGPKHGVANPTEDTPIFDVWGGTFTEMDSLDAASVMMYVENELESEYGIHADIMVGEATTVGKLADRIMEYK